MGHLAAIGAGYRGAWPCALAIGLLVATTPLAAQTAADPPLEPAAAASAASAPQRQAVLPLRALRDPLPGMDQLPPPTVPEVFNGYPDAPPFSVLPRKPELPLHPCSMCHNLQKLNTTVRQFKVAPPPEGAPHAGVLRHGKGRIWCLDCHMPQDREWLRTVGGARLDFNDSSTQCGQCHSARHRDWAFGGHGKRVAGWTGERVLYACTHCHDPHQPQLKQRQASKPPPVRAGLQPMALQRQHAPPPWRAPNQGQPREAQARH